MLVWFVHHPYYHLHNAVMAVWQMYGIILYNEWMTDVAFIVYCTDVSITSLP